MKRVLLFILMITSSLANATDLSYKFGLGFNQPNQDGTAETKYLSIGIQDDISRVFKHKFDLGAWFDSLDADKQKRSSGFVSSSLGIKVEPGFMYMETFWGVSYITQTDIQLGTQFEFTEEIGIGIQDLSGKFMGLEYRHFSNAGISLVNKGRDFILINVGFTF